MVNGDLSDLVIPIVVAPHSLHNLIASTTVFERPEYEMATATSSGLSMDALISCISGSLLTLHDTPNLRNLFWANKQGTIASPIAKNEICLAFINAASALSYSSVTKARVSLSVCIFPSKTLFKMSFMESFSFIP